MKMTKAILTTFTIRKPNQQRVLVGQAEVEVIMLYLYLVWRWVDVVGGIGKVTHLEASFGLVKSDTPRILSKEMGGGASLDLGVYLANLVRHTFNKEWPQEIVARGDLYPSGKQG